jgi:hypothetical protein
MIQANKIESYPTLRKKLPQRGKRKLWVNAGGQLLEAAVLKSFQQKMIAGKVNGWDAVHAFYKQQSELYSVQKLQHALDTYCELYGIQELKKENLIQLLSQYLETREWMVEGIYNSRAKDYSSPFRSMVYENMQEAVTGTFNENSFIADQQQLLKHQKKMVSKILKSW